MATEPEFKDPQATIPLGFDWSAWLAARGDDTIAGSSWAAWTQDADGVRTASADLTFAGGAFSDTATSVKCSGGTLPDGWADLARDPDYWATNTITTAGGLTEERSIPVYIVQQ